MRAGELVAERFEIVREAGAGGMSTVYQAHDRIDGRLVALKMLEGRALDFADRFTREAKALAELTHPGIVGYIAHGDTVDGKRYLAMEWLEGEDLSERLQRTGLTLKETLTLLRNVAESVGFAHARGIVHRDVKPSNLFLPGGFIERVKLLDFGVARVAESTSDLTRTGARVGTPAYMSPEQARGESQLGPTADVFALGCVFYQCLTGRKPFTAEDPLALVAKILLADPAPPSEVEPLVPPAVDALCMRMLAKNPADRPVDGTTLARELASLEAEITGSGVAAPATIGPSTLTGHERRLLCVVMVRGVRSPPTVEQIRSIAEGIGARCERLSDGTIVITLSHSSGKSRAATDLAAEAARAALAVRRVAPGARIALATGRAVMHSGRLPVGEAIDRVARLLRVEYDDEATFITNDQPPRERPHVSLPSVRLDDVTAGLLDARFDVGGDENGLSLRGERELPDATRRLLGRPTPCVGRDAELAAIEAVYSAAVNDGEARAVLVTAPAGVGKSRLRYELTHRLTTRDSAPTLLTGRGDPVRAGAPFAILADAIRRIAGVQDDDDLSVKRSKLRARLSRYVAHDELPRISEFVGELAGVPFPDEDSVPLRAARSDAMLMGDQMRRAFSDWLEAECHAQPVVLVLEDLHWGDPPTVNIVDAALRALRDRPFLVLALARPEVHDQFPGLWAERGIHEVRLNELSRKASERLVRSVLGADAPAADVARLVERAAGNAFYLEELIRAQSEGRGAELPETVLAMTQARLEAMEPDARHVLRAASVFGEVFWSGAVTALLGEHTVDVSGWLDALSKREVITRRGEGRFRGAQEYVFRHALVREAAYAMLTDVDRRTGHKLAAGWLELQGETEAIVLAEHLERGNEPERALVWYRRAAEQALAANDFDATVERAQRAKRCGANGEMLGGLLLIEAEARGWRAEWALALTAATEALRWLPDGSDAWFAAAGEAGWAAGVLGNREEHADVAVLLETQLGLSSSSEVPTQPELTALTRIAMQSLYIGNAELAERLYARLAKVAAWVADRPSMAARIYSAQSSMALFQGNAARSLMLARAAADNFAKMGDLRNVCMKNGSTGYALLELGDFAASVETLRTVLAQAERMGLSNIAATARQNLGLALGRSDQFDEARTVETAAMEAFRASKNRRMEAASRYYLAHILQLAGELETAEREARAAVAQAQEDPPLPPIEAEGTAFLAQILLARGRPEEARQAAAAAKKLLDDMGGIDGGEGLIRLVWAEALHATGDLEGARAAIASARDWLLGMADKIDDAAIRQIFLERVPDNARTLALAATWVR
jgi:hypothetical protein